jgi:hypothetical protein
MAHAEPGRPAGAPAPEPVDVRERGANQAISTRRLFIQLQVFSGCADPGPLVSALDKGGHEAVLYGDVNDPLGVGVLLMAEDPAFFATRGRELL